MSNLNQPSGWDEQAEEESEWTPARGLFRAAWRGGLVAIVLFLLLLPVAKYVPTMLGIIWLRVALGFALAWILSGVVQNAAGMVGWPCTALALALALLVGAATYAAMFFFSGAAASAGATPRPGAEAAYAAAFLPMFLGMAIAAGICHRGSPGMGFLSDLLMSNPLFPGSRR